MFGNLLKMASSVIPQQSVQWVRFLSRTQDDRGRWVNTYAAPQTIRGSWQAVDDRTVKELGFDTSKQYCMLYTSHPVSDVNRGEAPDRIMYNGQTYDVVGETDWFQQDGWKSVYCVLVKDEPA